MKKILILALISIPFLSLGNDSELKICLTGSTEKALPKYGEAFVNGAIMAISELDKHDKNKVVLNVNYYDSNPLAPIEKLKQLRKASCDAIIGFSTGNDLLLIKEPLEVDPVLTLSIYGDPQESFLETKYLRTMQPSPEDLVSHLFSRLPFKIPILSKVLIVTATDRSEMQSYKQAYINKFKKYKSVDFAEVIEQTHNLGQVEELVKRGGKWDYVVLLTRSLIAAELTDLIYKNSQPIILGTKYFGSADLPAYFSYLKNKKIQAYFSRQNCSCDQSDEYLQFRNKYVSRFNANPMAISMESYDAAKFILQSLKSPLLNSTQIINFANSKEIQFIGVSSFRVGAGFKVSSSKRYLIKVDKSGYSEIK